MSAQARGGSAFSRSKPTILLTGLVMVVLGIVVILHPITAMTALVRILGWVMVAFGVVTIVTAVMRGNPLQDSPGEIALGIVTIIPGLIMGIFPEALLKFAWTIVGVVILITGVLDVIEAGDFRRVGSPLAVPATVSGLITALLGLVLIIAPLIIPELGILFAAVALVVDGVTEILFGLGA